jgi:hypothetical protein
MVLGFDFDRWRSGPFEGPAIVKPPALPGDSYLEKWLKPLMQEKTNFNTRKEDFNLLKRIREIAWRCVGPIRFGRSGARFTKS